MAVEISAARPIRHRPRTATVFMAAFVAGAVAAVGVNRALDVRLAQAKPQVECEPVFVALRPLPAGVPVTVWDVALRDLPKAMVPATALRVTDSFEGRLLKYPLREGQPLLSAQLAPPAAAAPVAPEAPTVPQSDQEAVVEEAFVAPVPAPPVAVESRAQSTDPRETAVSRPDPEPSPPRLANRPSESPSLGQERREDADQGQTVNSSADVAATDTAVVADETRKIAEEIAEEIPAPRVAAAEPDIAALTEPTPAPPQPQEPTRPVSATSEAFAGPTVDGRPAAGLEAPLDMPSRPAVDIADLPSVMATGDDAPAAAESGKGTGVRYLVVPERIARQADTSFTTPSAPEAGEPAKAATRTDRGPAAAPRSGTATPTPMPPAAVRQPETGRQVRPAAPRQPQGRGSAATSQQQGKPRAAAGQPAAAVPQPTGPRAWGGMFPNVSAGLEAMGSWRSGSRDGSGQSDRGSTTR